MQGIQWIYDDGGRKAAGYKGDVGDCVTRAVAIAAGLPYQEVYDGLEGMANCKRITKRGPRRSAARNGVRKRTTKAYMERLGWTWIPTMKIGTG